MRISFQCSGSCHSYCAALFQGGVAFLLGTLLVVLSACGTSRPAMEDTPQPEAFPDHSMTTIVDAVRGTTDTLRAFEGEVRMDVNSPMQSGRFRATLRQQRADSLWMNVRGPLGINAARMLITADSFYVHNRIEEELAVGSVESAQQVLPVPPNGDALFQNLLGLIVPPITSEWTLRHDNELYHLDDPAGHRTYSVDPSIWRVVRFVERDANGSIIDERVFTDHVRVDGVVVPNRILLRRPGDDVRAIMTYRSLTLTPDSLSFSLDVPSDIRRVALP